MEEVNKMKTLQTFVCKLSIDFLFSFVTRGLLYGSDGKKTDIPKEMILERERESTMSVIDLVFEVVHL